MHMLNGGKKERIFRFFVREIWFLCFEILFICFIYNNIKQF